MKSRKHLPGRVWPALPALYFADAQLIGLTNKISTLWRGLFTFCLESPGSTTYTILLIVSKVSAILVAKIILRPEIPNRLGPGVLSKFCSVLKEAMYCKEVE